LRQQTDEFLCLAVFRHRRLHLLLCLIPLGSELFRTEFTRNRLAHSAPSNICPLIPHYCVYDSALFPAWQVKTHAGGTVRIGYTFDL
jgi:hypothetical protein